jgi:hypothetical protein
MSDFTNCLLQLGGILDRSHLDGLKKALQKADAELDGFDDLLTTRKMRIDFYDVSMGRLSKNLESTLIDLHLSYSWVWSPGPYYPGGIRLRDARTGVLAEFSAVEEDIALLLDEVDDPERLAAARRCRAFADNLEFIVFESQHELLSATTKHPWVQDYLYIPGRSD